MLTRFLLFVFTALALCAQDAATLTPPPQPQKPVVSYELAAKLLQVAAEACLQNQSSSNVLHDELAEQVGREDAQESSLLGYIYLKDDLGKMLRYVDAILGVFDEILKENKPRLSLAAKEGYKEANETFRKLVQMLKESAHQPDEPLLKEAWAQVYSTEMPADPFSSNELGRGRGIKLPR